MVYVKIVVLCIVWWILLCKHNNLVIIKQTLLNYCIIGIVLYHCNLECLEINKMCFLSQNGLALPKWDGWRSSTCGSWQRHSIPGMETRRSKKYLRYLFSLLMLIIQVTSEMLLTSLMAKKIHPDLLNTVSRPRKTFFLYLPSWLIKSIGIKFNWIACLQTALKVVIFTQSEEMARFRQYLATYSQIKISPIWSNRFKYLRVTVYNLIVLWSMKQG